MARLIGKAMKLQRRAGTDLGLKRKDFKSKSKKAERRPGQHGNMPVRPSNYGVQLAEKQKIKRIYGVSERQFRNYYFKASRKKGATGVVLLQLLECRLDNIVYRAGFASTRAEARQLVSHQAILVNGYRVNIPSCELKSGAVISLADKAKQQTRIDDSLALRKENNNFYDWIQTDADKKTATFIRIPDRPELPAEYNEQLIVELYSK